MNAVRLVLCAVSVLALETLPAGAATAMPDGKGEKVICRGYEAHTSGRMVQVGQTAPDFQATNADLKEVSLSSFKGKKVILNIFPSLDTPTCAMSVRQFNDMASGLDSTVVVCMTVDLGCGR